MPPSENEQEASERGRREPLLPRLPHRLHERGDEPEDRQHAEPLQEHGAEHAVAVIVEERGDRRRVLVHPRRAPVHDPGDDEQHDAEDAARGR